MEEDAEKYGEMVKNTRLEVERLVYEDASWEICKRSKDVIVSRIINTHSHGHAFKTETTIPLGLEELSRRIHPCGPYRTKWDSMLNWTELIQKIDDNTMIMRHVTKSQLRGLITGRDSIDLCFFSQTENCRSVVLQSVVSDLCPPDPSFVRAWTMPTGMFLYRTADPNITKVVSILNIEMRLQMIPISIAEAFIPRCCLLFVEDMKKCGQLKEEKYDRLTGWT